MEIEGRAQKTFPTSVNWPPIIVLRLYMMHNTLLDSLDNYILNVKLTYLLKKTFIERFWLTRPNITPTKKKALISSWNLTNRTILIASVSGNIIAPSYKKMLLTWKQQELVIFGKEKSLRY